MNCIRKLVFALFFIGKAENVAHVVDEPLQFLEFSLIFSLFWRTFHSFTMTRTKTVVRILVSMICFYGAINGQILNRRQQALLQRQQTKLDQQQETLEKQLLSQVSYWIFFALWSSNLWQKLYVLGFPNELPWPRSTSNKLRCFRQHFQCKKCSFSLRRFLIKENYHRCWSVQSVAWNYNRLLNALTWSLRLICLFCSFCIFKIPIQAIRAVNELVRTLASVKARLNGQQTADLVEKVQWSLTIDQDLILLMKMKI